MATSSIRTVHLARGDVTDTLQLPGLIVCQRSAVRDLIVNFVLRPRVPVAQLDERNKSFGSRSTAISTPDQKVSWAIALPWLSYGEDWLCGGLVQYLLEDHMRSALRRPSADEACEMGTCIKSFG
jgi:hypothetical protein